MNGYDNPRLSDREADTVIKWTNKQSETERLTNWMSEELIHPDGLLDSCQDGWMKTDRNTDRQANIMSERQRRPDTAEKYVRHTRVDHVPEHQPG